MCIRDRALIDDTWKTHLRKMDELKQSVRLAVHEQKDPLLIYKFEAFELFKGMLSEMNKEVSSFLLKAELPTQNPNVATEAEVIEEQVVTHEQKEEIDNLEERTAQNRQVTNTQSQQQVVQETVTREEPKIGRNDKVIIKNVTTGETQTVKFKQALPLSLIHI